MRLSACKYCLLLSLLSLLLPGVAVADSSPLSAPYKEILNAPADRDANLHYATLAIRAGDYEAAIAPLERIALNEPENMQIRYQIGSMYGLLNSADMANVYFHEVAESPYSAPTLKAQAVAKLVKE